MGISSTPLAVEAYRRLLIVRRVADGIVWNHHRRIVTNPEFRLFVLEQEFGQKRGGCLGSIADLGYIDQDWIRSGNLCVLSRTLSAEAKTKNRRPKSSGS